MMKYVLLIAQPALEMTVAVGLFDSHADAMEHYEQHTFDGIFIGAAPVASSLADLPVTLSN